MIWPFLLAAIFCFVIGYQEPRPTISARWALGAVAWAFIGMIAMLMR